MQYQVGQDDVSFDPPETYVHSNPVNANAGTTQRVLIIDGVIKESEEQSGQVHRASELNPHGGTDSVFATAVRASGDPFGVITEKTLITIDGFQSPAATFEKFGLIHRDINGKYVEGPAPDAVQSVQSEPEVNVNHLDMPQEVADGIDRALVGVADHHIAPLTATGVGVATGELGMERLIAQLVQFSGATPAQATERAGFMIAAHQTQADSAMTSRGGVSPEDLPDLWAWAKANHPGALKGAIQKQAYSYDFSGYRDLAAKYLMDVPPKRSVVDAAGYTTRQMGNLPEVLIDGRWLTIANAAKLGMF